MKDNAKFSPLDAEMQNWIQQQLHLLGEYARHLDGSMLNLMSGESLDELWLIWKKAATSDSEAVDSFLNAFGIGFGQLLVNKLGFEWVLLEDDYGTDIAVRALPGAANARICPLHFVLKRWESNEDIYVEAALTEINNLVNECASDHGVSR